MLISGAALLCFPREMPEYRKKRVIAMKKGKLPTENKDIGKGEYQNKGYKIPVHAQKTLAQEC